MKQSVIQAMTKIDNHSKLSPEESANFLSRLGFDYIRPYLHQARKNENLSLEHDLYPLSQCFDAKNLTSRFATTYQRRMKSGYAYIFALVAVVGKNFLISAPLEIIASISELYLPLLNELFNKQQQIISSNQTAGIGHSLLLLLGVVLARLMLNILYGQSYLYLFYASAKARSAVMGALFEKTLKMDPVLLAKYSNGTAVNTMSTDVNNIENTTIHVSILFVLPIGLFITTHTLLSRLGLHSLLVATGSLVIYTLLQVAIYFFSSRNIKKLTILSDHRIKLTEEVIIGARVLRLYGMQKTLLEKIEKVRQKELSCIRFSVCYSGLSTIINKVYPIVATSMILYYFAKFEKSREITATLILLVLSVISNIANRVLVYIPLTLPELAKGINSAKRVSRFLNERESVKNNRNEREDQEYAVILQNAQFERPNGMTQKARGHQKSLGTNVNLLKFTLNVEQLAIPKGALVAVLGSNGTGKSTLLESILNIVPQINKKATISIEADKIGFAPQNAFISNCSIRSNVLQGRSLYDEEAYLHAIEQCGLVADLKQLPNGEYSIAGERGGFLSGGQRQRIGLARVAYAKPSMALLDDPLSALNATVAHKVFTDCIKKGLLSSSARIMTMSRPNSEILSQCDMILILDKQSSKENTEEAKIQFCGTYSQLIDYCMHDTERMIFEHRRIKDTLEEQQSATFKSESKPLIAKEEHKVTKWSFIGNLASYISLSGGIATIFGMIVIFASAQITQKFLNDIKGSISGDIDRSKLLTLIATYGAVGFLHAALLFLQTFFYTCVHSMGARKIQKNGIKSMLAARVDSVESKPVGSYLAIFSRDLSIVDINLANAAVLLLVFIGSLVSTFILLALQGAYVLMLIYIIQLAFSILLMRLFKEAWRQSRKLISEANSRVIANYSETLDGLNILKPIGATDLFLESHYALTNQLTQASHFQIVTRRWMTFQYSNLLILVEAIGSLVGIFGRKGLEFFSVYLGGLLEIVEIMEVFAKRTMELESALVSFRLIEDISSLPMEMDKKFSSIPSIPNANLEGSVEFRNVSLEYQKGYPVLNNINFSVDAGERIAIIGRTGAGKSSILGCLLRFSDPKVISGKIFVGGQDTAEMPLDQLRESISVVPQEPILFQGTIRFNLDPLGR